MNIDYSKLDYYLAASAKDLRDYQLRHEEHSKQYRRYVLDSPGGTGKTLMTLRSVLRHKPRRILITASANALYTWYKELQKWFPDYVKPGMYNVIDGVPARRQQRWGRDSFVYITTFTGLLKDLPHIKKLGIRFDALIADEFDTKGLRNRRTGMYRAFKEVDHIPTIILMSGSPIRRGPQEFWAPFNILDTKVFNSYWKFENTFCVVIDNGFGREITGVQNTKLFATITIPYLFKVSQEEADRARPKLTREVIPIRMNPIQERHYRNFEQHMYTLLDSGELKVAQLAVTRSLRQRQLLCCPRILGIDDDGAAIEWCIDKIRDAQYGRTTIFTPFKEAIPFYKAALQKAFPKFLIQPLQGGDEDEVQTRTEAFRNRGGIMVCSIHWARSYELETSQDCFFPAYDWDQWNNQQSEWRCQRMSGDVSKPLTAFYLRHFNSTDGRVLEVLNQNTRNCKVTFQDIESARKFFAPIQEIV